VRGKEKSERKDMEIQGNNELHDTLQSTTPHTAARYHTAPNTITLYYTAPYLSCGRRGQMISCPRTGW
jgi:hypothetical protein